MVYTWTYILMYKHVCTLFRPVCTCLYKYIRVSTYIDMYIRCTNMYIHVCSIFLITYMYVKVCTADVSCTDGYIHFKECTDTAELCTYTDVSL